jgi:benzoate membrane transport protein
MKFSLSLSHVSAGFIAVLVGYTSSAAIVFQAATAAGATAAEISSWLWAIGMGMGLSTIGLSLYYRMPVLTAWSTPGAALLVTGLSGITLAEAVGVFLFSSLLITLVGFSGGFDKIMRYVPAPLAAAMLAGVLFQFGLNLFNVAGTHLTLVLLMLMTYLGARRLLPRYVIPLALLVGFVVAGLQGQLRFENFEVQWSSPVWVTPEFTLQSLIGVGIPLFIVTMASQNLPGIAVLRANGYKVPASPLISTTGITGLLLAPFGGFAYNLAAITAAICMGKDAGPDPDKRYWASVSAGCFYLLAGVFGATVAGLFAAFPEALVMAIAGLALLGTIGNSLAGALADEHSREASLLTFLITASGISLVGIGSAFWGILVGLAAYYLLADKRKSNESEVARDSSRA